jgi:NAD+ synthetase
VGLAQVEGVVGDLTGNVRRSTAAVRAASELGAQLVVLPELMVPGGPPRDLLLDRTFVDAVGEATADLARRTAQLAPVVVGTVVRSGSGDHCHPGLWSAAAVLQDGEVTKVVARRRLRSDGPWHEPRWLVPGPPGAPIDIDGLRVQVVVGDDLGSAAVDAEDRTVPLLVPSATAFRLGGLARRRGQLAELRRPVAWVNLAGASDESVFAGGSVALARDGRPLVELPVGREALRVVDLAQVGGAPSELLRTEPEELFTVLACGVRSFAQAVGRPKMVVGVSGGVDSAVAAALAVEAVGPEQVLAVTVPSRHTDPRSTEAASELGRQLGVRVETVELEPLHRSAETALGSLVATGTGYENVQARLRMVVLSAFVNHIGGLLLGTSNKTELTLGYGTLYGDLAGTLLPIGDLTKPQVAALGRWLHDTRGWVPEWVLERAPTAELAPGQMDPFDYPTVAPELERLVQSHRSEPTLVRSEFKRRQAGVILQVSEVAFGPGRLMPVARR